MLKFINREKDGISNTCRYMCLKLAEKGEIDPNSLSFLYCFCWQDPVTNKSSGTTFTTDSKHLVDLTAGQGIYLYDNSEKCYTLFGVRMSDTSS